MAGQTQSAKSTKTDPKEAEKRALRVAPRLREHLGKVETVLRGLQDARESLQPGWMRTAASQADWLRQEIEAERFVIARGLSSAGTHKAEYARLISDAEIADVRLRPLIDASRTQADDLERAMGGPLSKWIGETEKNLAALFDAAEAGHAILLFDEADSLFGKRTEVKSGNDRNANLEVNYLLQRIERFSGICFLTTNHESAIDEAFRRRLAFHVRLSVPDAQERAQLWQTLLPSRAPVAESIDFATLGERLVMSGGYIRNAVLRAAFEASDEGTAISMDHLWRAGTTEYETMGKFMPSSR